MVGVFIRGNKNVKAIEAIEACRVVLGDDENAVLAKKIF
jgi:hypothetical protein